ncbi:NAD(P)-dependent oxidoreductase [Mycolicibacterium iranicum]|uniref:NAD-dependent epimerase n=1 Tax=Mycolicibacterium iranicum TaxID=912594 RepID=A0A178M2W6_MYCIR|nr:NAD(P)H-binding protein [Mycolicibacterium iranicum]OAN41563.1 NAD-dependent epimerase [Mycolicibacterium iranicum]
MSHLVVFGANGPTGRRLVEQALAGDHRITAVTRKPDEFPLQSERLDVVAADVTDPDGVDRALAGAEAVISTYGVPYSRTEITVYSQGIANITQAMTGRGVQRLVCVSSTTVATEDAPGDSLVWRKVVGPFLRNSLGRTLYDDMERMEHVVQNSNLDWTIVRPGGLFNAAEPTADYEVGAPRLSGHVTSRADLADFLIKEATEPRHPRAIVEVITRSARPSPLNFLKEALGGS